MLDFPAAPFVRFFDNHGLLTVASHPQWFTVQGGSQRYVAALLADMQIDLRLGDPVAHVTRKPEGIDVESASGLFEFDRVVFATHAPQALE